MAKLTKAEEQIMQCLWNIKKGFLKDIVEEFPEPKPANTTISTVIRVLVQKKFIGFKAYNKNHLYFPIISKNDYLKTQFKGIVKNYFSGSLKKFTSFFANENDLKLSELEEIKKIVEEQIKKEKEK